ncbi:MAG: ImmA/IrrE family metallo-endopeptidase [Clostridia bacterium]|nr:ImmA/IrrE family metallo-endopeptidase [Clostridia bacterium]
MRNLNELYQIAQNENIDVYCLDLLATKSLSMCRNGKSAIAIDPFTLLDSSEEAVLLAHELGHCVTGSFYNLYSDFDIVAKHELRADKWAIKKLVPKDELNNAFEHGIVEPWDLAEYFDVTEDFIIKAVKFYKDVA